MDPKPRVWPALVVGAFGTLLAQAGALAFAGLVVAIMVLVDPSQQDELLKMGQQGSLPLAATVGAVLGSCLVFGGLALLLGSRSAEPLASRLGLGRGRIRPAALLPVAVVGLAAGQTNLGVMVALFGPEAYAFMAPMGEAITQGSWLSKLALIVVGSVGAGVCEELLFRGYVQRRLLARWSPPLAIGVASVLFAMAHLHPLYALTILPIGIWLGYLAWRADSTLPSMLAHGLNNLVLFTMGALAWEIPGPQGVQLLFWSVLLAASLALALWLEPALWPGGSQGPGPRVAPVHRAVGPQQEVGVESR
jgi:membrane protease YdiL (CAAX protease family)